MFFRFTTIRCRSQGANLRCDSYLPKIMFGNVWGRREANPALLHCARAILTSFETESLCEGRNAQTLEEVNK